MSDRKNVFRMISFILFHTVFWIIIFFCVFEIGFAIFNPQKLAFPRMYQHDEELGYKLQSNKVFRHKDYKIDVQYYLDWHGNRAHSINNKIDSLKKSILIIGDSMGFGQGVEYEYTFAGLLRDTLDQYQIINTSVPGWGPIQYKITLAKYLNMGIDIKFVIMAFYPYNDIIDAKRDYRKIKISNGYIVTRNTSSNAINRFNTFIVKHSHFLTWLYRKKESYRIKKQHDTLNPKSKFGRMFNGDRDSFIDYTNEALQAIYDMSEMCLRKDISLLVLIMPSEHGFTERTTISTEVDYSFPNRIIYSELMKKEIHSINLWPNVDEECYIPQDVHFSKKGHKIVADLIMKYFLSLYTE